MSWLIMHRFFVTSLPMGIWTHTTLKAQTFTSLLHTSFQEYDIFDNDFDPFMLQSMYIFKMLLTFHPCTHSCSSDISLQRDLHFLHTILVLKQQEVLMSLSSVPPYNFHMVFREIEKFKCLNFLEDLPLYNVINISDILQQLNSLLQFVRIAWFALYSKQSFYFIFHRFWIYYLN